MNAILSVDVQNDSLQREAITSSFCWLLAASEGKKNENASSFPLMEKRRAGTSHQVKYAALFLLDSDRLDDVDPRNAISRRKLRSVFQSM